MTAARRRRRSAKPRVAEGRTGLHRFRKTEDDEPDDAEAT